MNAPSPAPRRDRTPPAAPGPRLAHGERGGTAIITVLMTGMMLTAIIAATTQVSLGARRTAADDATSARLLLGAESGQARFLDCTRQGANFGNATTAATLDATLVNNACATGGTLKVIPVTDATVTMKVARTVPTTFATLADLTAVDLTSTAKSGTDRSSVTQRFTVSRANLPRVNVPGAVTSFPGVDLNGNASIGGAELGPPDGAVYTSYLNLKRTGSVGVSEGSPIVMDASNTPPSRLRSLEVGSYLSMPLVSGATGVVGAASPRGLFRIDAKDPVSQTVVLTPTNVPGGLMTPYLPTSTGADLVLNPLKALSATGMTVQNSEAFVQNDTVSMNLGTPAVTYAATVTNTPTMSGRTTTMTLGNWRKLTALGWENATPSAAELASFREGQPVSKSTLGVVTAGAFNPGRDTPVGGVLAMAGSAVVPSPLNDTLFVKTFGTTPDDLQSTAKVLTESQFSAANRTVSGVTWLTSTTHSINMNSNPKLNGNGILIVDGDLTINQTQTSTCDMSGLLYVRGNLRIQGNLQLCGAIVVEGSVLDGNNDVVAIDTTQSEFLGTGRKIQYDPRILFDITQGTGKLVFAPQAGTWRQQ